MKKYPLNQVDYYERFRDMIDGMANKYGDAPAISWFTRKQEEYGVSYRKLQEDVRHLQEMLIVHGLAGKHIAMVGENSYEWLLAYFAAAYCGSVAVCIDVEQSDETILQMLDMADTDAIFCASAYQDLCRKYAADDKKIFSLSGRMEGTVTVAELIEEGKKIWKEGKENKDIDGQVTGDLTATIVFTSGTTSYSKPVMLSQSAVMTNAADAIANVTIGARTFTSLPFYHTYGMTCAVLGMLDSGTHLYINGNLKTVMRDLQLAKADTLLTVPLMLETISSRMWQTAEESGKAEDLKKLFRLKKFQFSMGIKTPGKTLSGIKEKCLGSIELIIVGGAHMNGEIMEQFQCMGITVIQGYGITECAPLVSVNRNQPT